ncbi:MAG: hypothetical protein INQ03_03465 [Candidatus Heimdallarchaeota archaeon]|nr:hypothetical protein [Candidatus Heimdallarchaeota archaeon]
MNRMEYLSGLSIGHIFKKLQSSINMSGNEAEKYLRNYFNRSWEMYHSSIEFHRGFKVGYGQDHPPILPDMIEFYYQLCILAK